MSKVSIIIPCHNDGGFILQAIASARAQTHHDVEIIIVNDGSQDPATLHVLSKLKGDHELVVIDNNGNKGAAAARNTGIARATGAYILPLDADDLLEPSYVAKAAMVLDNNSAIAICYCQAALFGIKKGKWRLAPFSVGEIMLSNMIFASAMFRKDDWRMAGGYYENVEHIPEDHLLWLGLLQLGGEVHQIPEVLFYYRIRAHSRSSDILSGWEKRRKIAIDIFRIRREFYAQNIEQLYMRAWELQQRENERGRLLASKLMLPLAGLEKKTRDLLKKLLGRA